MIPSATAGYSANDFFAPVSADVAAPVNEIKTINAKTIQEPPKSEMLTLTATTAELCLDNLESKLDSNAFVVFTYLFTILF